VLRMMSARLPLEASHQLRVLGEFRKNHFQRDIPSQFRIRSAIHLAHSTGTDRQSNFIGTEFCAGEEDHRCVRIIVSALRLRRFWIDCRQPLP